MYQLIVFIVQFCFPYPNKGKPSIEGQPTDQQLTTPSDLDESADNKMDFKSIERKIDQDDETTVDPDGGIDGNVNGYQHTIKGKGDSSVNSQCDTPNLCASSAPACDTLTDYPLSSSVNETSITRKNVDLTVSYNPSPKSLYTSFEQLRSPRPNCFISSITRFNINNLPTSPGSAVKTTEIKSPEEVTGVKSPSPEAWKVAIETGNGINWTQAKPPVINSNNKRSIKVDKVNLLQDVNIASKLVDEDNDDVEIIFKKQIYNPINY